MKKTLFVALFLLIFICIVIKCFPLSSDNSIIFGNSIGNLHAQGAIADHDSIIYFSNWADDFSLYKFGIDDPQPQKICAKSVSSLNYINNTIYFRENEQRRICYLKDGKIIYTPVVHIERFIASEKYIYYTRSYGHGVNLYRCNLKGHNQRKIADDVGDFCIYNGTIYFQHIVEYFDKDSLSEGIYDFYKVDTNGKNPTKISENYVSDIMAYEDNIYYLNHTKENKIYKLNTNTMQSAVLVDKNCYGLYLYQNDLYFSSKSSKYGHVECEQHKINLISNKISNIHLNNVDICSISAGIALCLNSDRERYFINLETLEIINLQ